MTSAVRDRTRSVSRHDVADFECAGIVSIADGILASLRFYSTEIYMYPSCYITTPALYLSG